MTVANDCILTLDIDWAPDCVIDHVARMLVSNRVKATWFVTHRSEAVERLQEQSHLFELGVHPNMLPGSTHGASEDEVLTHVKNLVPAATCMRTHGLYQTTNWLVKACRDYGIRFDVSLFLPRARHLRPHRVRWQGVSLWRIPYFWEDDSEMFEDEPIWSAADRRLDVPGLRVFDFHPVHVALNTSQFAAYERLKRIRPLPRWDERFLQERAEPGLGPNRLFSELVASLAGGGTKISEIRLNPGAP